MGVERTDWGTDPPTAENTGRDVVAGDDKGSVFRPDWSADIPDQGEHLLSTRATSIVDDTFGRSEIGSAEHMEARSRAVVQTIFTNLGNDAVGFSDKINGLSDDTFRVVNEHLGLRPGAGHNLAADDVAYLASGEVGEALAELWGRRAARNFGVVDMWLRGVEQDERLSAAGRKEFAEFVQGLSPEEMIAAARALTGM